MRSLRTLFLMTCAALASAAAVMTVPGRPAAALAEAPARPLKAGFMSMTQFMKASKKWQSQAGAMNVRRAEATKKLTAFQDEIRGLQNKLRLTTDTGEKADLELALKDKTRELEDRTKKLQGELERETNAILVSFKKEFEAELKALAAARGLDAILAYPGMTGHGLSEAEAKSTMAIEMVFRPSAIMPLYLDESLDLTQEMIERFDATLDPAVGAE
jgi:Skp family chaperone for outer membrane proteins